MEFEIIETEPISAQKNMALDLALLESLERPTIHFYNWKGDCLTYGHFIKPEKHLNLDGGVDFAKRPTGGGIVLHSFDLAFAVLVPANSTFFSQDTMENYAFVNKKVARAIKKFNGQNSTLFAEHMDNKSPTCNFCMASPTKYDVMIDGRKIGGAAQRQTKRGFLHQGTISIAPPPREFLKKIIKSKALLEAILNNSYTILNSDWSYQQLQEVRAELGILLKENFKC